jgi:anaphase-promoting complex subunit 10
MAAAEEDEEDEEEDEVEEVEDDGEAAGVVPAEGTTGTATTTAAAAANNNNNEPILAIPAVSNLDSLYGLREIGREALCWQLSSAKPGNGVEQIRDQSTDTYWQSDGVSQPHWIQVHFARRVAISHVCLFLDYNLDESYTPKRLNVQVGMTTQDLSPAVYPPQTVIELNEPVGWCIIPLQAPPDPLDDDEDEMDDGNNNDSDDDDDDHEASPSKRKKSKLRPLIRTHMVQISIVSMHQNGRDTHIRQVQLYGPRTGGTGGTVSSFAHAMDAPKETAAAQAYKAVTSGGGSDIALVHDFSTELSQYSIIR